MPDPMDAAGELELSEPSATPPSDSVHPEPTVAARSANGAPSWSFPPDGAALTPDPCNGLLPVGTPPLSERIGADAAATDVGELPSRIASDKPELIEHDYQPLIARLEAECRRVISAAETEAEMVRSKAEDEARRVVSDAHRERSALLRASTSKQALMYQEAESEIQRWLEELEQERQSVLDAAHDEADRRLRAAVNEAEMRAQARLQLAESEAARIVADARAEATRRLDIERSRPAPEALPPEPTSAAPTVEWTPESSAFEVESSSAEAVSEPAAPEPLVDEPEADLSAHSSSEPESTAPSPSSSPPGDRSTVVDSHANGSTRPPAATALGAGGDSLSSDQLVALLRGTGDSSGVSSAPGAPGATPFAALLPTESDVPDPASVLSEAAAGDEPSESRRERRRRRRFGRAQY